MGQNDIIVDFKRGNEPQLEDGTEPLTAFFGKDGKRSISQLQLMVQTTFEVNFPGMTKSIRVQQVTRGDLINILVNCNSIIVSRGDMNHASEIYSFTLKKILGNKFNVNTATYDSLAFKQTRKKVL
jgi:hypothetical protein